MKASDLRNAKLMIEALDQITADLETLETATALRVSVRLRKRQLKFKPNLTHYTDYLKDCKLSIETVLVEMGVDLSA